MRKLKYLILVLIVFSYSLSASVAYTSDVYYPAKVKDVSDRSYEKEVINLIDNSKDSIILSMYIVKPGDNKKHTVNRLLIDLEEALDRGVKVTLYLNTKVDERDYKPEDVGRGTCFDVLRKKGAMILLVNPRNRLHDKLLIVDSRFVVVGSTNWSISALEDNYEASVLIDSPDLAKDELNRLKEMHLVGEDLKGPPQISIKEEVRVANVVSMPCVLLEDQGYLPQMITTHDARAMDLYFLLLGESLRWDKSEFYISMEKVAVDLGMPSDWTDTALRRQVIKSLSKLKNEYGLIDFSFKKARAAYVEIVSLKGKTFQVEGSFFQGDNLRTQTQSRELVYLIKDYLKSIDRDVNKLSNEELADMFSVSRQTIKEGLSK